MVEDEGGCAMIDLNLLVKSLVRATLLIAALVCIVYVARLRQAVERYDAALVSCLHSADEKLTALELIIQEIR